MYNINLGDIVDKYNARRLCFITRFLLDNERVDSLLFVMGINKLFVEN